MTREEKLTRFIERLEEDGNTLSVILFGSQARGNSRPESDIDLVVILKEGYKRVVEYFEDQAFEIIYTTEQAAIEYWQNNKYDAVGLWIVAKVLFDRDGTGEKLKNFGKEMCEETPPEVSESALAHLRFDFEDSLKAIEGIMGKDPATASLLLHKNVSGLINFYFDLKRIWRPAPKQQLQEILICDAELGNLFRDFYTNENLSGQLAVVKKITDHILSGSLCSQDASA